ncbi:hypothetical protein ACQY0O_006608 [Thecaphora frezii]
MPAQVFVAHADSPSPKLTSPTPSFLAAFPHQPTQPTLTTALHRSNSHIDSLSSPPRASPSHPHPDHPSTPDAGTGSKSSDALLYRRILFAELSPDEPTPPLTGKQPLDDQVYLLLAFLLRATVLPWYSKLTPNRQLLTEIIAVIRHVVQQVGPRLDVQPLPSPSIPELAAPEEAKLANYRLHALLGRELPIVLRQHYRDVRTARSRLNTAWAPSVAIPPLAGAGYDLPSSAAAADAPPPSTARAATVLLDGDGGDGDDDGDELAALLYDVGSGAGVSPPRVAQLHAAISPHPGVDAACSVEGRLHPVYLRIAVSSLLGSLLPSEHWSVEVERYIVRDVTVMVLRSSLGKCSRPWFLVQSLNKVLDALKWPDGRRSQGTAYKSDSDLRGSTTAAADVPPPSPLLELTAAIAIRLWSLLALLCTTVLPYLARAYLDLFNPYAARSAATARSKVRGGSGDEDAARLPSTIRQQRLGGTLQGSLRHGSVRLEAPLHGRYPSTTLSSGFLFGGGRRSLVGASAYDADVAERDDRLKPDAQNGVREAASEAASARPAATAEYVVPWLQLLEEVTEARTRMLGSALFGLLKLGVGMAAFGRSIDSIITSKINEKLSDTATLSGVVAAIRKGAMPNGYLPGPVPDPTVEVQEAEWRRLRRRLLQGMPPMVRVALLGADERSQYVAITRWLSPICAPDAAGPNTHLAVMLLERVIAMLCPELVEA